jgi:hypothetical protein
MLFDRDLFLKVFIQDPMSAGIKYGRSWQLASNIFAAEACCLVSPDKWSVTYYFDDREVRFRDEWIRKWQIGTTLYLRLKNGFIFEEILYGDGDRCISFRLKELYAHAGISGESVLSDAKDLFVVSKGDDEIQWFESPEPIVAVVEAA